MQIERKQLAAALKTVKPGLADKSPIIQFLYFWLDGKHLTTYNDVIGIELPFATEFKCGLSGALLSGLVENSRAKNADLTLSGSEAHLKLAGAKAKLAALPIENAVWAFPDAIKGITVPIDEPLLEGLKHVELALRQAGGFGVPGVCFSPEGDHLYLYTTDAKSLAWAQLPASKKPLTEKVGVPREFCEQVLALCQPGDTLTFLSDSVVAQSSTARVFSRVLDKDTLLDFRGALDRLLTKGYTKRLVPLPTKLGPALDRIAVLVGNGVEKVTYEVDDQGVLTLFVRTAVGELTERVALEGEHAAVTAYFDSSMVKRGVGTLDRFLFTADCFVMMGGKNLGYIVTAME